MKIHIISDNEIESRTICGYLSEILRGADHYDIECSSWSDVPDINISPEILFLDTDSKRIDIWEKVTEARKAFPSAYTVLAADDDRFAFAAFSLHLDGYLIKPIKQAEVEDEFDNYLDIRKRRQIKESLLEAEEAERANGKLTIRTGRNFECFAGGIPVHFKRRKTKELLKILAENPGTMIHNDELTDRLWGNNSRTSRSYLRTLKSELCRLFEQHGCADVLVKHYAEIGFFENPSIRMESDVFTTVPFNIKKPYSRNQTAEQYYSAGAKMR